MNAENGKRSSIKQAIGLAFISIFAYLASYYIRNLLSVATPGMIQTGEYTEVFIGTLSSVYFLVYACGQFVNGLIGDKINPKYMISVGLTVTATAITVFPLVPYTWMQVGCFALMGVGLSMLRGPIMKMVAENVSKDYSRVICTMLSAVSFVGPLIASVLAIIFKWNTMFIVAGLSTYVIAAFVFVFLTVFERKGLFVFHGNKKAAFGGYLQLLKLEHFVFYMLVGGIVEIAGSAITFWIPTYLSDALRLDKVTTNLLYSAITIVTCLAPFFALFVFKLIKEKDIIMLRVGFTLAVIAFVCMLVIPNSYAKILCLTLAKFFLACCSSVLWSIYIPGMGKSGKVSSINGIINCTGYLSASVASKVFSKLLGLSWTGVILVWCGIAGVGLIASLIVKQKASESKTSD